MTVSAIGLLNYWRSALTDGSIANLQFKDDQSLQVSIDQLRSGLLDKGTAARLRKMAEDNAKDPRPKDGNPEDDAITLLVAYKTLAPEVHHTVSHAVRQRVHAMGMVVSLLPNGSLKVSSEVAPWIPRAALAPSDTMCIVGAMSDVDDWLRRNPFEVCGWDRDLDWADRLWRTATHGALPSGYAETDVCWLAPVENANGANIIRYLKTFYDTAVEDLPSVSSPLLHRYCYGTPAEETRTVRLKDRLAALGVPRGTMTPDHGLSASQSETLVAYLNSGEGDILAVNGPPGTGKTTLLQALIATEMVQAALRGGEPALIIGTSSNNQAVTNINTAMTEALKGGASESWSRRWVDGISGLGLYFPSSTRKKEAEERGYQYASRSNGKLFPSDWEGLPALEREKDFIAEAHESWLGHFRLTYPGVALSTIKDGLSYLRQELTNLSRECQALSSCFAVAGGLVETFGGIHCVQEARSLVEGDDRQRRERVAVLSAQVSHLTEECRLLADREAMLEQAYEASITPFRQAADKAETDLKDALTLTAQVRVALPSGGFFSNLMNGGAWKALARKVSETPFAHFFAEVVTSKDPSSWERQLEVMRDILQEAEVEARHALQTHRAPDELAETRALTKIRRLRLAETKQNLDSERKVPDHLQDLRVRLQSLDKATATFREQAGRYPWFMKVAGEAGHPQERADWFDDILAFDTVLDRSIRYELFHKACRYWEGRWILECQNYQLGLQEAKLRRTNKRIQVSYPVNTSAESIEKTYRRWSMVTPCFIVTTNSLPSLPVCKMRNPENGQYEQHYMPGLFDLLIVDEAGQTPPHDGAPAFSFAKRATVVGDIYQIEPIVSMTAPVDEANAREAGVREALWDEYGPCDGRVVTPVDATAIPGSVMAVAQSSSRYTAQDNELRGMFLSEHRRCRTDIIEICNDLVYAGKLHPMRPEPEVEPPLPALGWSHVRGTCEPAGGSKRNLKEAAAIARWIAMKAEEWCAFYKKDLGDVVAVVTPFAQQKFSLMRALSSEIGRAHAEKVTIGTVHALQGAERPIVIFSPTLDATSSTQFLDGRRSLLNVAISRAKDSFVVIGCMDIFHASSSSALGIVGKALLGRGTELSGVTGNWIADDETMFRGERISTHEGHLAALDESVRSLETGDELVVVSPFLNDEPITHEELSRPLRSAVERNAIVTVVTRATPDTPGNASHQRCIQILRSYGVSCYAVPRIHSKSLIMRDYLIEGSFNWLSVLRQRPERASLDSSWKITGSDALKAISAARDELAQKGVWRQT